SLKQGRNAGFVEPRTGGIQVLSAASTDGQSAWAPSVSRKPHALVTGVSPLMNRVRSHGAGSRRSPVAHDRAVLDEAAVTDVGLPGPSGTADELIGVPGVAHALPLARRRAGIACDWLQGTVELAIGLTAATGTLARDLGIRSGLA